ncbi:MAG: membrane lipoprotein lipid attachment site-containing protein [Flavobacteriaceae bacterium]|nr:membrane lipoprotein lipid attachment site-containing protein [Flavobacteriaceae bacterium]
MKKIIYLFLLILGVTGCSVESIDSTENLLTADAKFKIQEVGKSADLLDSEICAGEAPVFVFNFPQNQNGPNNADTNIKIQIETFPGSGEWDIFEDLTYAGAGPEEYTYNDEILEVGTYSFRVKIGAGGFDFAVTLNIVECPDCDESFSYTANGGNSYTFFYTPAEDMANASLVFTFAQSVVASGYDWPDWNGSSSTRTETMDLDACTTYEWEVELSKDCSGSSPNSNVWTDFKVDGVSKKNSATLNITQSCN